MPSNTNGQTHKSEDAPEVKSIVFNPSVPLAEAFAAECAKRDRELMGKRFDGVTSWLDVEFTKGIKSDIVREALTAYLGGLGYTWEEPEVKRLSSLMLEFRRDNERGADESDEAYDKRYEDWKKARVADAQREANNAKALDTARMQKIKDLMAMGEDIASAYAAAMLAFPDGMQLVKARGNK